MMKRLIPFILLLAGAVSCDMSTEPFLYRGFMMGFLQTDGSFVGDDGNTYVFSNASAGEKLEKATRMLGSFDVTEELPDGRYSAKLLEYTFPLYKEPVKSSEVEDPDTLGNDLIDVDEIWYSGGCLNMTNRFRYSPEAEKAHTVSLLADTSRPVNDTLFLSLRHNAGEDAIPEGMFPIDFAIFKFYSSFPIVSLFPEGKSDGVISLSYEGENGAKTIINKIKL